MSARPRWSGGCYTCRRRKVKCDETKPECNRCQRSGRICSGYRTAQELTFRSMNASVAARTNVSAVDASTLAVGYAASAASTADATTFSLRPSTNWEQCAIDRLISHYMQPASAHDPGYMDFLPYMLQMTYATTRDAFLAAALHNFGHISKMPNLQAKSKIHYGRALRTLQTALNDMSTAVADSTLLAVIMLQVYEIMAGTIALPGEYDPHEAALGELLRLRRTVPKATSASIKLDWVVQARKEVQGIRVTPDCAASEGYSVSAPTGILFRTQLQSASAACANLRSAMSQPNESKISKNSSVLDAIDSSIDVYHEIIHWPKATPIEWRYKPHTAPKAVQACGISQVFLFASIHHGAMWQVYFCTRVQMCENLLRAYTFLEEQSPPQPNPASLCLSKEELRRKLIAAVDDICSCAPFLLSDIDNQGHVMHSNVESQSLGAFFLLRGLMVANAVEELPPHQRCIVLHLLHRVGAQFGIKVAWSMRNDWIAKHQAEAQQLAESWGIS